MIVIDASIAVQHLTAPEPQDIVDLVRSEAIAAPDLIVAEVCNALATLERHGRLPAPAAERLIDLLPLVIDETYPLTPLMPRAFAIAADLRHPAYDCFYLALAEAFRTVLVTADLRLLRRLSGTPYQSLARPL